jgi:DNA-binding transcriptional ArsR family regulator
VWLTDILVLDKLPSVTPDSRLLAAVASPRRREILRLLWTHEQSAGAVNAAMPDVTFGAVSLQLRALRQAGLITLRIEGRHRFYRANRAALGPMGALLEQMWTDALWSLKLRAELEASRRGPRGPRPAPRGRGAPSGSRRGGPRRSP